jgi:hypothetical protein
MLLSFTGFQFAPLFHLILLLEYVGRELFLVTSQKLQDGLSDSLQSSSLLLARHVPIFGSSALSITFKLSKPRVPKIAAFIIYKVFLLYC